MHSAETLKAILTAGAGLRIDAMAVSINTLSELVVIAHNNNAQLTVTNAGHILKDSLERLAMVGGHSVSFEL